MAFKLNSQLTEIRIFDERNGARQILYARDPSVKEQLSYSREAITQRGGTMVNRVRPTRLKFGCGVLDHAQAAGSPQEEGYGFEEGEQWVPLTLGVASVPVDRAAVQAEYSQLYGSEWATWIESLEPWKLLLLAQAPEHVARVAVVMFEGASDLRQQMAAATAVATEEEDLDQGN